MVEGWEGRGMRIKYLKYLNFSLFVIIGMAIPVLLVLLTPNDISVFTRDVFSVTKVPPIVGFLSNLGAFVWCAALSVIMFSIYCSKNSASVRMLGFLYLSAVLTGWILLDDFFQMHDYWFILIGINENDAYIGLAIVLILYIVIFFRIIIKTNYILFLLALTFLFFSFVFDIIQHFYGFGKTGGRWYVFLEDAPKWIGACFWASYYFSTARRALGVDLASQVKRNDQVATASNSVQLS